MQELFVREQVCSGVRRGFLFYQLVELGCGREVDKTRTTSFERAFCSCGLQAEGRELEAQRVTAARVEMSQGGDHLKSFLHVLAWYSSNLSASEQRL